MLKIKRLVLVISLVLALSILVGCQSKTETKEEVTETEVSTEESAVDIDAEFVDGTYFTTSGTFENGWMGAIVLEVKEQKIASIKWTGISSTAGADKYTASQNGGYPMVANGGAQSEWYEQVDAVVAHALESQSLKAIEYKDEEGHTDAITGVSIGVSEFYTLAAKALAAGPTEAGPYKDGAYYAEAAEFDNGWKSTVNISILNGNIVSVDWNGLAEEGDKDKDTASIDGDYAMSGELGLWHEQAMRVEENLIATQDATVIEYSDDEGHTDAITGVSIHVSEFFALAEEALAMAK